MKTDCPVGGAVSQGKDGDIYFTDLFKDRVIFHTVIDVHLIIVESFLIITMIYFIDI